MKAFEVLGAVARSGLAGLQILTIRLAGQLCGIPVEAIRDVLGPQPLARIPLAPPEVAGSLNLRGRIVTAIDLRRRLGFPPFEKGVEKAMSVVVEVGGELYSFLADEVGDVITLPESGWEPNPATLDPVWQSVSHGIQRLENELLVVLDIAEVMDIGPANSRR
jgi:purine-binding chemotaxis protein CheW